MLKQIVDGKYLRQADKIQQWLERDRFNDETISSHSYKVVVITKLMLDEIFGYEVCGKSGVNFIEVIHFRNDCLNYAMFHDWDEILFKRDVSHEIKYNDFNGTAIRGVIDNFATNEAFKQFPVKDEDSDRQKWIKREMITMITDVDDTVKKFVKVADFLAMRIFIKREIDLGNTDFELDYRHVWSLFSKAKDELISALSKKFGDKILDFTCFSKL